MMQTLTWEEPDLFPPNVFHRRHTAFGRAAPPTPKTSTENAYVVFIPTDITSVAMPTRIGLPCLEALNATLVDPTLQVDVDPAWGQFTATWAGTANAAREPAKLEVQEGRIEGFLETVYSLARSNDIESATDRIFDHIDKLLCDRVFVLCDEILQRVDVEELPTALMRSFLTITAAAKNELPSRKALHQKIERKMLQSKGEEKTKRLIGKLV